MARCILRFVWARFCGSWGHLVWCEALRVMLGHDFVWCGVIWRGAMCRGSCLGVLCAVSWVSTLMWWDLAFHLEIVSWRRHKKTRLCVICILKVIPSSLLLPLFFSSFFIAERMTLSFRSSKLFLFIPLFTEIIIFLHLSFNVSRWIFSLLFLPFRQIQSFSFFVSAAEKQRPLSPGWVWGCVHPTCSFRSSDSSFVLPSFGSFVRPSFLSPLVRSSVRPSVRPSVLIPLARSSVHLPVRPQPFGSFVCSSVSI